MARIDRTRRRILRPTRWAGFHSAIIVFSLLAACTNENSRQNPGIQAPKYRATTQLLRDPEGILHAVSNVSDSAAYCALGAGQAEDFAISVISRAKGTSGEIAKLLPKEITAHLQTGEFPASLAFSKEGLPLPRSRMSNAGNPLADMDRTSELFGYAEKARIAYDRLSADDRKSLDEFARCFNAQLSLRKNTIANRDERHRELARLGFFDVRISSTDIITGLFDFYFFGHVLGIQNIVDQVDNKRPYMSTDDIRLPVQELKSSNQWVISGQKSETGKPVHLIDPHLPLYDARVRLASFELVGPRTSVRGAAIPGVPVVMIGHTDTVTWSHTANPPPSAAYYQLLINTAQGELYRTWRTSHRSTMPFEPFEISQKVIKLHNGSEETFKIRRSTHGAVIAETTNQNGQPIAITWRFAGETGFNPIQQLFQMNRARTFDDFMNALRMQQLPNLNVMISSSHPTDGRHGRIGYIYNGIIPRFNNPSTDPLKILDSMDSGTDWNDIHPFSDLPQVYDKDFLVNCNTSVDVVDPEHSLNIADYPAYFFAGVTYRVFHYRGRRAFRMLASETGRAPVSGDTARSIAIDPQDDFEFDFVSMLERTLQAHGLEALDIASYTRAADAMSTFRAWNKRGDMDSREMAQIQYLRHLMRAIPQPSETLSQWAKGMSSPPQSVEPLSFSDAARVLPLLANIVDLTAARFGALPRWGDLLYFHDYSTLRPTFGAPNSMRSMGITDYLGSLGIFFIEGGQTWVQVVRHTDNSSKSDYLKPYLGTSDTSRTYNPILPMRYSTGIYTPFRTPAFDADPGTQPDYQGWSRVQTATEEFKPQIE